MIIMELKITKTAKERIDELDKSRKERIEKKLREIKEKINTLDLSPDQVIEKRLKGNLSNYLQQRVGDLRLWFTYERKDDILYLEAVYTKEEAKGKY